MEIPENINAMMRLRVDIERRDIQKFRVEFHDPTTLGWRFAHEQHPKLANANAEPNPFSRGLQAAACTRIVTSLTQFPTISPINPSLQRALPCL
jgi:hypothetical protein